MPDQSPAESQQTAAEVRSPAKPSRFQGVVPEQAGIRGAVERLKEQGLRGLFSRGETLASDTESSMAFQARQAETREEMREITARDQARRAESFREGLTELDLHDFSRERGLRRELGRAQHEAKAFLAEKLARLGLPADAVRGLRPRYINRQNPGGDENGKETVGYTLWNGLVVVEVDTNDPLDTALTAAHELSHAARGVIHEYRGDRAEGADIVRGLDRYDYERMTGEGDLLENMMSVWDALDIYQRFKQRGLFRDRTSLREWVLRRDEPSERSEDDNYGRSLDQALVQARSLGIPDSLLEPYVFSLGNLQQITAAWRIARLMGGATAGEQASAEEVIQRGRDMLERSRFTGTREAHEQIERLFGEDAHIILSTDQHPKSFEEISAAIQRAEERAGITQVSH